MTAKSLEDRVIYEIDNFGRVEVLKDIPHLFEVLDYLEEEYGLSSFYRYNEAGKDKIGKFRADTPIGYLKDVRGVVLKDDGNVPEHEDMYHLPNIYINLGTLIMEIPSETRLEEKYDKGFWDDLATDIEKKHQEFESYEQEDKNKEEISVA